MRALVDVEVTKVGFGTLRTDALRVPPAVADRRVLHRLPARQGAASSQGATIPVERTAATIPPDLQQHPAAPRARAPADHPQRARRGRRRPRRGPQRAIRRAPGAARDRQGARDPRPPEPGARGPDGATATRSSALADNRENVGRFVRAEDAARPRRAPPTSSPRTSSCYRFLASSAAMPELGARRRPDAGPARPRRPRASSSASSTTSSRSRRPAPVLPLARRGRRPRPARAGPPARRWPSSALRPKAPELGKNLAITLETSTTATARSRRTGARPADRATPAWRRPLLRLPAVAGDQHLRPERPHPQGLPARHRLLRVQ